MKVSGIYIITNLINGKHYIGQSIEVCKRLSQHKSDLKARRHHNTHLQNSVNEYGLTNFCFSLLEEWPEELLSTFENYWCLLLNTHNDNYGYNLDITGPISTTRKSIETCNKISEKAKERNINGANNPFFGKTHSQETKKVISLTHKGKSLSDNHKILLKASHIRGERHHFSVKVFDRNTGKVYPTIREAAKQNNLNPRTLRDYLRGNIYNKTNLYLCNVGT